MILRQEGAASRLFLQKLLQYQAYIIEVNCFSSVRQDQNVGWSKVVHVAIEFLPVGSKPPVAVGERISKGEKHDFGAAASFSTTTSSLQGRTGSSAFTPKLIEHIEPGSTWIAEKLSPCIA